MLEHKKNLLMCMLEIIMVMVIFMNFEVVYLIFEIIYIKLHKYGWIDNQTRAVIIQFTLYNPNAQLFTSATFLIECLSTGGIYHQARFEPMQFDGTLFFIQ
jgi:hypothetical protein